MKKVVILIAAISFFGTNAMSQDFVLPPIPKESDAESVKRHACEVAINEVFGWQLGEPKRLRDWCRNNGYITYRQQLEAERIVR